MPLLTFSVKKDDLLAKKKLQSIRFNSPYWARLARRDDEFKKKLLHIWWHNPRFMRRDPDVYKMGIAKWGEYYTIMGYEMTDALAKKDGFETRFGLHTELARRNGIKVTDVLGHRWTVLGFGWLYGPFTKTQSSFVCWPAVFDDQNQAVEQGMRCPWCGLIGTVEEDFSGEKVHTFCRCPVCGRTWS